MMKHIVKIVCFLGAAAHYCDAASLRIRDGNQTVLPGCQAACDQLFGIYSTAVYYPSSDNAVIWDAKQQETQSACRIEPSGASDVAQILSVVVENGCQFAVKGGGHSRDPNDSKSVGGVTIDLVRLSTVEVSAAGSSARVGGGTNVLQAFSALEQRNLSYVGGRVASVGVGGFTLGGGTSPLSNRYGWALDNVYEFEVVLANSTIVTASETQNPDLYWALRGGGNNFGIVTTFTIRTFPQGPVFNGQTSYARNETGRVLDKVFDIFTKPELTADLDMSYDLFYTYSSASGSFALAGTQRYAKPVMNPPIFRDIDQIPTTSRSAIVAPLSRFAGDPPKGTRRHLFGTLSVLPSRAWLTQAIDIFEQEAETLRTVNGLTSNFITYPLHTNAISAMRQRGGNALGIDVEGPLFLILISTEWTDAAGDVPVSTMTAAALARMKAAAQELGVDHPYLYINYSSKDQADEIFAGYGEDNVQRLKEIQLAVDPEGIFTSRGLWTGFIKLW